MMFLRVFIYRN